MSRHTPLNYALLLLKLRDRSTGEIIHKMKQKGFSEKEITETVNYLVERQFLDDERFVRLFIESHLKARSESKLKLKMKLRQLYLPDFAMEKVDQAYAGGVELGQARKAAEKWLRHKESIDPAEKKIKLSRHLAGRGFGWEIIKQTIAKLLNC